jgi:hypothetical protein
MENEEGKWTEMEGKRMLLISTASATETAIVMDILKQNGIAAISQGKASGEALEAYVGSSPYGDDIFVNEADLERAVKLVHGVE